MTTKYWKTFSLRACIAVLFHIVYGPRLHDHPTGSANTHFTNTIERSTQTNAHLLGAIPLYLIYNTWVRRCVVLCPTSASHGDYRFFTMNQLPIPKAMSLPMSDTTDHSTSSRFRALFKSALEDYETKTKITLDNHPLSKQLENCNSVESIACLLQDQARAFGEFRGRARIMRSIKRIVSFLYNLSATAALGDDLGLVRLKMLTTFHVSDIVL